jgi:penicillin-binding protein 1A
VWRPIVRIGALVVVLAAIALGVTGCVMYNQVANNLPDPSKPLKGTDRTTQVLDRSGHPITDLFADQNRQYVPLKEIPRAVREAVIATEDQRYYEHPGVDLLGMLRALVTDIRAGSQVQGGSTITQQYVKQAFVGDERSLKRKVSEAVLAYRVEQRYTKDQILEMYLNTIYFGHGAYGVQTAAKTYFGKPVQQLTLPEAAMIAGVIKSPGRYSPYLQAEAAKNRRDTVLKQMRDQSLIDGAAYGAAVASPVKTAGLKKGSRIAPYFVEYLKELLVEKYGEAAVYRGGLKVTTTLDLRMQAAAEKAISSALNRKGDPSAALVAIDPKTGQLLAMVGGRDFASQQYNVAVQGHRQTGSAFKPFVLARALSDGISPEQTFESGSIKIPLPGGQTWSVTGAHGSGGGLMRLRPATWESVNSIFAQLMMKTGPEKVLATAKAMGITTKITPVPAVALGGMREGVTPLEMANAYATLAASGTRMTPYAVLEVRDADGKVLESPKPVGVKALDPAVAYLATDILKGVITNGTGTSAAIGRPAAGKTGTTQEYRDAWFCGYTPNLAASVWVGYPESQRAMTSVHGIKVTGGSFPAQIWASFMRAALASTPKTEFKRPAGLVDVRICLDSGGKATQFCPRTGTGLFLEGHEPADCTLHSAPVGVAVPKLIGLAKQDAIAALQRLTLKYSVVERDVTGVAAGIVADQDPKPGSRASSSTVVTLIVSNGGVTVGKPPVASFDWTPKDARPGIAIKFDASASTDDGKIVKWVWEFGDGTKDAVSGKIASHVYAVPWNYDVTLWVTDDAGNTVSITKKLKVQ